MKTPFVARSIFILIALGAPLAAQIKTSPTPALKKPNLPLADLVITRFELRPAYGATTNDMISFYIEITNRGVRPAIFKRGDILFQISLPGGSGPFQWPVTQDLAIGSEQPWHAGMYILRPGQVPAGAFRLKVMIDPGSRVTEVDESNNQMELDLTIANAEKPDLVIGDIHTQQFPLGDDLVLNIVVTVRNSGRGNAFLAYQTKILRCAELNTSISIDREIILKAEDSKRFVFTLLNFDGPRSMVFLIDPENVVNEADETNNSRTVQVAVK